MLQQFRKYFARNIPHFVSPYSTCYRIINDPQLHSIKRGTGGRSSFNGVVATVFGATGFIGKVLVNRLGKIGTQLILPCRRELDDNEAKDLKVAGDLGKIWFQEFDLKDTRSIYKAVKHSNVVINLIGKDFETKNFSYEDVHVTGAKNIAKACREQGVERLIHVSSLNVTENPQKYVARMPLKFLPTKLQGECAVFQEFPCATVIRPAAVFGIEDKFLWPMNAAFRRLYWSSNPFYKKGEKTVRQPVYVSDLAQGIVNAIYDTNSKGKIYQAVGPKRYLLSEIYDWISRLTERDLYKLHYRHNAAYDPMLKLKLFYISKIPHHEKRFRLIIEQFERESVTDVVDRKLPTLKDLGVELTPIDVMEYILYHTFLTCPWFIRNRNSVSPPVESKMPYAWDC